MVKTNEVYLELLDIAKEASKNAYSIYSKFSVGACILYESGKKYTGCNVENASYGLSLCAERNAISNAISQGETTKPKAIAIYSPKQKQCLPCGACRQWMIEFADDKMQIIVEGDEEKMLIYALKDLFPHPFALKN